MSTCTSFLQDRLAAVKLMIVAYENASLALAGSGVQSYTLDTGQSVQKVTKADIFDLKKTLDGLYNTYATLEARLGGCGVPTLVRPVW